MNEDPTHTHMCMDDIGVQVGLWCWAGQECQGLSWLDLSLLALLGHTQICHCLYLGLRPWLSFVGTSCAQGLEGASSCSP